jgi:uncharacterized membrane protein YsdA (DUF1294 family)
LLLDRVDAQLLGVLWAYYLGLSLASLLLYGWDKLLARLGHWRVPERVLHLLALAGGWPGGWLAQRLFRHKIAKAGFRRRFRLALIANLALLMLLLGRPLWDWLVIQLSVFLPLG